MERMEDKDMNIIRDKINCLDSLPEGYSPSIESKWELLEAGLQEKKPEGKRKKIFYMAIAACFILLCGFGWLLLQIGPGFFNENYIAEETLISNQNKNTTAEATSEAGRTIINEKNTAPASVEIAENSAGKIALPGANISPPVFRRGRGGNLATESREQWIAGSRLPDGQEARNDQERPAQQLFMEVNNFKDSTQKESPRKLASANQVQKKRKARYVEIDFEDAPHQRTISPPENYAENTFKFRFGSSAANSGNADYGQASFFKIQKSFPVKDN